MKYLKITDSQNPTDPNNGYPYTYYNEDIEKVWLFLGIRWILSTGRWVMEKSWSDKGVWYYYGNPLRYAI